MYIYNNKFLNYISPIYQTKLNNIKAEISHSGNLKTHKNYILIKSGYEKLKITALINPKIHTVADAKHIGGEEDNKNLFLEYICKFIINKSIQECSDHGAMNLEYILRDHNKKPDIPGIITLNNIDPIFKTANILLRNLLSDYRVKSNYKSTENFYFSPLSNNWRSLNKSERLELLKNIINESKFYKFAKIERLEGATKLVVSFKDDQTNKVKRNRLLDIENFFSNKLNMNFELYLQAKIDQNKLRVITK
ncbi:MAG: hypothetical protein ACJ0A6_00900 [Dehalococcoidia bacterium]